MIQKILIATCWDFDFDSVLLEWVSSVFEIVGEYMILNTLRINPRRHYFQVAHCELLSTFYHFLKLIVILRLNFLFHLLPEFGQAALSHSMRTLPPLLPELQIQIFEILVEIWLNFLRLIIARHTDVYDLQSKFVFYLFLQDLVFFDVQFLV